MVGQLYILLLLYLASLSGAAIFRQQERVNEPMSSFGYMYESMKHMLEDMEADAEARPARSLQLVAAEKVKGDSSTMAAGSDGPANLQDYCAGQQQNRVEIHHVGEKVMADWEDYGPYYPAKITRANADGTFNVHYDDGFDEEEVKPPQIRAMSNKERDKYAESVKKDPACKFQGLVKKLKPKVDKLKENMAMWCTNQRAQISAIKGKVPPRPEALAIEEQTLAIPAAPELAIPSIPGTAGEDEDDAGSGADASGSGAKPKGKATAKAKASRSGGTGAKTSSAIKSSKPQINSGALPPAAIGGSPGPALPDGGMPYGIASPAPAQPAKPSMTMDNDELRELEALRTQIQDNDAYIEELKAKEEENANRLQKLTAKDGAPTVPPGIKTVDDLILEYKDRIAAQEDEIARRKKRIQEQEMELAKLGGADIPLSGIDKEALSIEGEVAAAWKEMQKLDGEGELDADLKHILDGIMMPLQNVRKRVNNLQILEDKTEGDIQQDKKKAKKAAEAARKKALKNGLSAKKADEAAENAALEIESSELGARLEMLKEAQVVQYDFAKSAKDAEELDVGLHPHGQKWWRFRYEHAYIEAILMVWISLLMLLWRRVVQEVKKILQAWAAPHDKHLVDSNQGDFVLVLGEAAGRDDGSVYLVWLSCLCEMMLTCILVFISVWVICKTSLVDLLPFLVTAQEFHVPNSGEQYRRLLVDCSSIYFFAILMYFILVFPIARHARSLTHKLAMKFALTPGGSHDASLPPQGGFGHMASEVAARGVRSQLQGSWFAQSLSAEIDSTSIPEAKLLKDKIKEMYRGDWASFPMAEYMIMTVHVNTQSLFEFAWYLWLPVVVCFLCFSQFHRWMHMGYLRIMLSFTVFALLLILIIMVYTDKVGKNFHSDQGGRFSSVEIATDEINNIHKRLNTEFLILKTLQFAMFFQIYGVARMIGQPWMWELHFWPVLGLTCLALLWAILFILLIAPTIPSFCAVMAVPPYVNKDNVKLMLFTCQIEEMRMESSKDKADAPLGSIEE